jgi:hypothetical protein
MVLHRPVELAGVSGKFEFPARLGADEILNSPRVFDQINGPYAAKIPYSYGHYSKVVGILERVLTGVELGFNPVGNIDT